MRSIKCNNSRARSLVGRQRWLTKPQRWLTRLLARDRRNRLPHDGRSARPRRRRRRGAHLWRRQVDTRGRRGVNQSMGTQQAFNQAYPAMTGRGLAPVDTASFCRYAAAARHQPGDQSLGVDRREHAGAQENEASDRRAETEGAGAQGESDQGQHLFSFGKRCIRPRQHAQELFWPSAFARVPECQECQECQRVPKCAAASLAPASVGRGWPGCPQTAPRQFPTSR